MIPPYDSISAIESSAWLVFGWLAKARRSKTSHGDGGFVIAKGAIGGKSSKSDGLLILKWFHKVESWSGLHLMVLFVDSICFALGNKSGSFCEAVN